MRHAIPFILLLSFATSAYASGGADDDVVASPFVQQFPINDALIARVSAIGTGCPPDSWALEQPEVPETGFSMLFSAFVAAIGPNNKPEDNIKNCNIRVAVTSTVPRQYAVSKYVYRGSAKLDAGVTALHETDYRFAGTNIASVPPDDKVDRRLVGPYLKSFSFEDDILARNPSQLTWSPCATATTLLLNTRITLSSTVASSSGSVTMEAIDGLKSKLELGVATRECPLMAAR